LLNFFVSALDIINPLGDINNQGEAIKPSRKPRRNEMTKYYDYTVEGWTRIAIVNWNDEEVVDNRFGEEINEDDLPDGFEAWTSYEGFAHDDCTVNVVSEGGE
jgi:hypothetical protein